MVINVLAILFFSVVALFSEQPDQHIIITKATRVPGRQLNPGNYGLRVLGRLSDRVVIEIRDARGRQVVTFLGLPDNNLPRPVNNAPVYWHTGSHAVIRGIWIADPPMGINFVFEKEEAAKLAKEVRQPIPAIDPASEGLKSLPAMSDADRKMVTLWLLSAVAITPNGKQVGIDATKYVPQAQPIVDNSRQVAVQHSAPERSFDHPTEQSAPARNVDRMPTTASDWPSRLLIGTIFLITGASVLAGARSIDKTFHSTRPD